MRASRGHYKGNKTGWELKLDAGAVQSYMCYWIACNSEFVPSVPCHEPCLGIFTWLGLKVEPCVPVCGCTNKHSSRGTQE